MDNQQYSPAGFRLLPPVVKNLLIINGLFFLATLSFQSAFGIDLENILGLHYFKSQYFQPYQLVTYMFLHANFSHIFFNMFALWMFGYLLENVWGPKKFLTYYMVCGIGAALVQLAINWWRLSSLETLVQSYSQFPEEYARLKDMYQQVINTPTIGASGAVYGILLAFGVMFPNMLVYIYFLFPIKAKWIVIIYGALELFSGISNNPSDNVAHFAHLGGMLFGLLLIFFWKRRSRHTYN
ncbi:MAG: rhomboid family intramembrane serine protease [Bacteroidetes bacterium]|nr:rhomboid family intramembrane serine protease [Bacteroidota bacterium]